MDWKQLISDLLAEGLTQTEIAAACGTSQPYIHELKGKDKPNPSYTIGAALINLHKARCNTTKRKCKATASEA